MSSAFTFKTELVLTVIAETEEQAHATLIQYGGYIESRKDSLIAVTPIPAAKPTPADRKRPAANPSRAKR